MSRVLRSDIRMRMRTNSAALVIFFCPFIQALVINSRANSIDQTILKNAGAFWASTHNTENNYNSITIDKIY